MYAGWAVIRVTMAFVATCASYNLEKPGNADLVHVYNVFRHRTSTN